jgi:transposase
VETPDRAALPKCAPETNPIKRFWWHLHDEVTRNHRCFDIGQLLQLVMRWIEEGNPFRIEGHVYNVLKAARLPFGIGQSYLLIAG